MKFARTLMLGAAVAALGVSTGALAQTQRTDRPEPSPVQTSERPIAPATVQPERIILNLTADPAHQMAVTWRTAPGLDGEVEFAEAQDGPDFIASAVRVAATTDDAVLAVREAADFRAAYHSAVMTGLKPATVYVYRVGSGGAWSEWLQFKTAAATPEPFTFLYFGDMQNNILSEASRTLRMGFRKAGDAAFVIHAGDLINRHDSDNEWGEWFASGGFLYAQTPQMPTPGNHEYGRGPILNPQWRRQFTLPETGPAGVERLKETAWTVDYQGLRLISIDAPLFHGDEAMRTEMVQWLDQVLADNPNRWTVLFLHFPLFSIDPDRDNSRVRDALKPLIDKYQVDLVLQAHDHGYARGAIGQGAMSNAGPGHRADHGSTYVVSVAGPKMYPVANLTWADRMAERTQTFQTLDVSQDAVVYRAFTATGRELDAFRLTKGQDGVAKVEALAQDDANGGVR
ncbi:phosphoesterase [Brevundimonas intermedia]|uniref:Phosphoesterase n=1 Tax=Brevundimonas intermedia TaxID=74315 RepID=A0ABQ5TAD9_9CAUL|nr:metallophosphoesterase family protein [Brevundimonas intermedia]GLK49313.1 phosphoesterase [Brevundimonas intermedia]